MKVKISDGDIDIDEWINEMKGSLELLKPELKANFQEDIFVVRRDYK